MPELTSSGTLPGKNDFLRSPSRTSGEITRNSSACLIFYDVTNRASFEKAREYSAKADAQNVPIKWLVASKRDQEDQRQVATFEGENLALELGSRFFEVSMKSQSEVDNVMNALVERLNLA